MLNVELLKQARSSEKSSKIARRLCMLILFISEEEIFRAVAMKYMYNRYTVVL